LNTTCDVCDAIRRESKPLGPRRYPPPPWPLITTHHEWLEQRGLYPHDNAAYSGAIFIECGIPFEWHYTGVDHDDDVYDEIWVPSWVETIDAMYMNDSAAFRTCLRALHADPVVMALAAGGTKESLLAWLKSYDPSTYAAWGGSL
jgi:hypothetical protein